MNEIIREIEKEQLKANVDSFKVGDTVRVHGKIKEGNRERLQISEGAGTLTRAKLNYLRNRVGKKAKVKELVK